MSRYINADALIEKFKAEHDWSSVYIVEDMPSADVVDRNECTTCVLYPFKQLRERLETNMVEVVHGEWIPEPNCYYRCSNCNGHLVSIQNKINYSYCPYCGADMRGGIDDN